MEAQSNDVGKNDMAAMVYKEDLTILITVPA